MRMGNCKKVFAAIVLLIVVGSSGFASAAPPLPYWTYIKKVSSTFYYMSTFLKVYPTSAEAQAAMSCCCFSPWWKRGYYGRADFGYGLWICRLDTKYEGIQWQIDRCYVFPLDGVMPEQTTPVFTESQGN